VYSHFLIPLDGSEASTDLVAQVARMASCHSAHVTLLVVCSDGTDSPFSQTEQKGAKDYLEAVERQFRKASIACTQAIRFGASPYEVIVEVATERACDLIVLSRYGQGGLQGTELGSQAQMTIEHAPLPVLVLEPAQTANAPAFADEALAAIRDEHSCLAAINEVLREEAARARAGESIDTVFLSRLLKYQYDFGERLHHPKEEQYLFARLLDNSEDAVDMIHSLSVQHRELGERLKQIYTRLQSADGLPENEMMDMLAEEIDAYVDIQWRHLNMEEKLIIPAARYMLSAEDWEDIALAFRVQQRMADGAKADSVYQEVVTRLGR